MNLSKTTSYSLSVLSYMATHSDISFSASNLHEKLSIPYPYLRQLLKALTRSGFITSTRGRSGGFAFNKSKDEISLADIIEATDGFGNINRCILGFRQCPFDNRCIMHDKWEQTMSGMMKILRETTLADLAGVV
jgi:Rrf2 family protein